MEKMGRYVQRFMYVCVWVHLVLPSLDTSCHCNVKKLNSLIGDEFQFIKQILTVKNYMMKEWIKIDQNWYSDGICEYLLHSF